VREAQRMRSGLDKTNNRLKKLGAMDPNYNVGVRAFMEATIDLGNAERDPTVSSKVLAQKTAARDRALHYAIIIGRDKAKKRPDLFAYEDEKDLNDYLAMLPGGGEVSGNSSSGGTSVGTTEKPATMGDAVDTFINNGKQH